MVPIARASGDYSILMSLDKEDNGKIYLQDDRNRKFFSITLITNSFRDLLLNLEKENVVVGNLLQKRLLKNAKTEEEKKEINLLFDKEDQKANYIKLEI